MPDTLTPEERSTRMGQIRSKDTAVELAVRRLIFGLGFRYRLHDRALPGHPDIVFKGKRKVIFVHGCFWHRHGDPNCKLARLPKSRLDFWVPKLTANQVRDRKNTVLLRKMGWRTLVIWECEIPSVAKLERRIKKFLCSANP